VETPKEYLSGTESAVRHLLAGIEEYVRIFQKAPAPALVGTYADEEDRQVALAQWINQRSAEIQKSKDAQRAFLAQKYAMSTLCGSLLQVASTAIRLYSKNSHIPADLRDMIRPGSPATAYCVGRPVRDVPIGLVIYAGRNLYNHLDNDQLREPNCSIFERLTTKHTYGDRIRDPAFDLQGGPGWHNVSNVTSILNWRRYDAYASDMRCLLGI
jgi:hypothetical protein